MQRITQTQKKFVVASYLYRDAIYEVPKGCSVTVSSTCTAAAVDCQVEPTWSAPTACSRTCGLGTATITRTITQHPKHGGKPCIGALAYERTEPCNNGPCPWCETYQAEDAFLANGASFATDSAQTATKLNDVSAQGDGYVKFEDSSHEEIWWRVDVPQDGRYSLDFRYKTDTEHDFTIETSELLHVNSKYSQVITFPTSPTWTNEQVDTSLHQGINIVKIVTGANYGPSLDSVQICRTAVLARCTPNTNKTLQWRNQATTESGFFARALDSAVTYGNDLQSTLAGYIDLGELGPWHIDTNILSSQNYSQHTASDAVTAYMNGREVGIVGNGAAGTVAGSVSFEVRSADIQYRFDFQSGMHGGYQYHMAIQNGVAKCGGCSHVKCDVAVHAGTGMQRVRVTHNKNELFGNQHHCSVKSDGVCRCECHDNIENVNDHSPWRDSAFIDHGLDGTAHTRDDTPRNFTWAEDLHRTTTSHRWGNERSDGSSGNFDDVNGRYRTVLGNVTSETHHQGHLLSKYPGTQGLTNSLPGDARLPVQRTTDAVDAASAPYELTCQTDTEQDEPGFEWHHDITGSSWSSCPKSGQYLTGMLKHNCGAGMQCILGGKCCDTGKSTKYRQVCEEPSWDLSSSGTVQCSNGYYLQAIERGTCSSLYCIQKAKCCKNHNQLNWMSSEWKSWWNDNTNPGWMSCPYDHFIAGFKRGAGNDLTDVSEVLCVR
jgi:hypothetical protein